jgi:membrane protein required for colicin V production
MQVVEGAGLYANGVDLALLAWLVLSVLIGVARGFVFEVVSLLGWVVAAFGAYWVAPLLAPVVPTAKAGSLLSDAALFLCAFVALWLAWSLGARLLRLALHATPLRLPDRVLGAGFGLVRGIVVLLLVAAVIVFTPLASSPAWQRSQLVPWLNGALQDLDALLPAAVLQRLPGSRI